VAGLGIAVGPITGGWMIEHLDTSGIFLLNLPPVLACLAGAALLIPESRDRESRRLDLVGCGLSVAALCALVWALIEAPDRGWTDTTILAAFAGGTAIAAAFLAWERHTDHPMLDVGVFRNPRFSAASASITFVYFALMGVMYFQTTYLQSVLGNSALHAGLLMLPTAAGMMVAARSSVALTKRLGARVVVAAGLATVAGSLVMTTGYQVDTSEDYVLLTGFIMGAGVGFAMAPATEAIMGSLSPDKAGIGSAMNDVVREAGGTLGVAVLGSVLAGTYATRMEGAATDLPADAAAAATDSVGGAQAVAAQLGGAPDLVAAANDAFIGAMSTTAGIAAGIALAGALIAAAFLPARERGRSASPLEPVASVAS
jgi:Na+/melibiose symporter-like transporter